MTTATTPMIALDILTTRGLQLRTATNAKIVASYAERYKEGANLAPIDVMIDEAEGMTYLVDGHHRVAAAKKAGLTSLPVTNHFGDRRAAILFAAAANAKHGLPLTNDDKRRIADTLLADDEWRTWSDRALADVCHVSPHLIAARRKKLPKELQTDTRKGKDGTLKNTSKIGKKTEYTDMPDATPPKSGWAWNKDDHCENPNVFTLWNDNHLLFKVKFAKNPNNQIWYTGYSYEWKGHGGGSSPVSQSNHENHQGALVDILTNLYGIANKIICDGFTRALDERRVSLIKLMKDQMPKMVDGEPEPEELKLDQPETPTPTPIKPTPTPIAAPPSSLAKDQTRALAIVKKSRAVVAETLRTGKHQWTGTDRQLVSLALVVGVPVSATDEPWSDTLPARAFTELADRLKIEVAERLTSPAAHRLPPAEIIAGWWSIDMRVATMTAERFL